MTLARNDLAASIGSRELGSGVVSFIVVIPWPAELVRRAAFLGARLYTRDAGTHKVYWQGPSIGYDFGGEGSKTMILVYNLSDPSDIFHRFGGVQGSAYLIGGVGIQFQKYGDVILAPIRSGIGLRLGANVGYLKYTRRPTWNPF